MTDKQINTCEFLNICQTDCNGTLEDTEMCHCYELYNQLKHKEQECERLSANLKSLEYTVVLQSSRDIDNAVDLFAKSIAKIENENLILKAENEELKEKLSIIQHNCNCEGCKYYDGNTFKIFYECKAQKALQLSANSVTTKYCDLLKALTEIKEIALGVRNYLDCPSPKDVRYEMDTILRLISEVEDEN